jgi:excisionase family DNA binding protein
MREFDAQRRTNDSTARETAATRRRRAADRQVSPPPENTLLTVDQLCAELHISRSTFYDWRAKGRAPRCMKLPNGEIRIIRRDLDEWFESCLAS